ncbi:MAG: hypothetical protein JNK81_12630 [Anaerolineales bacterium]|nr:hypothetical protein [Anaerolineales bacterium]
MSDKKTLKQWWSGQSVTIRASIIAGIFSLTVALCGCVGGILAVSVNYYLQNSSAASVRYTLHINNGLEVMQTPLFFTEINGTEFGVVSTKCVVIDYGGSSEQFDTSSMKDDAQGKSYSFDIVTERPLVITNAIVQVKSYKAPPFENEISEISFFDIPGMGGVPIIYFPVKTIDSSTKDMIINRDEGSLRLDPGDAVTLVFPLVFADPGIYEIIFIVQGQLDLSQKVEFVSEPYEYAWLYVENPTTHPIKSSFGLAEMKWLGDCQ